MIYELILTELKVRDTSCPKGKKAEIKTDEIVKQIWMILSDWRQAH